jgi:hypothetical protein
MLINKNKFLNLSQYALFIGDLYNFCKIIIEEIVFSYKNFTLKIEILLKYLSKIFTIQILLYLYLKKIVKHDINLFL